MRDKGLAQTKKGHSSDQTVDPALTRSWALTSGALCSSPATYHSIHLITSHHRQISKVRPICFGQKTPSHSFKPLIYLQRSEQGNRRPSICHKRGYKAFDHAHDSSKIQTTPRFSQNIIHPFRIHMHSAPKYYAL